MPLRFALKEFLGFMDTIDTQNTEVVESVSNDERCILHIENFEGPLDLLWNLIKRAKIDIVEVSISDITEQYIGYLREIEKMDIAVATDFINMASELLYYKSKALLPRGEIDDDFFVPPLPPELVAKLLEYKKYQLSSMSLKSMYDRQSDCYVRDIPAKKPEGEGEFVTMSLFDLLNAFVEMMSKVNEVEEQEIVLDEILVTDRIMHIISILRAKEQVIFREIFTAHPTRAEVIATFLAILELAKLHHIMVKQDMTYGEIFINRTFGPDDQIDSVDSEFQTISD
jgi:segregation and condensation protein A